ncbi:nucleotide-diphospho-sugar transferase [Dipodascopsis uninucleata]
MEFQAIILCGPGRDLAPLVSASLPKALLPIANKPMIYYSLEWCQRAGITSAIVVCSQNAEQQISQYISAGYNATQKPSMKIEVVAEEGETGFILRKIRDKIKHDFVLVPCDFITDLAPQVVVDIHRNQPVKTIGTGVWYSNTIDSIDKKTLKTNLTVHTPISQPHPRLLDLLSRPKANNQVFVRMSMLWEYPQSVISTNLLEAFIYFFSRRVLDYDFKDSDTLPSVLTANSDKNNIIESLKWKKSWTMIVRELARESWKYSKSLGPETVGVYVVPKNYTFIRCKSISTYFEANRIILKQTPYTPPPQAATANGAAVGRDSLVGIGTILGEKTSIKRSIVGSDCTFGRECRLTGCVIMDGVVLGNGIQLENCIIGNGVIVQDRCRLIGCTVEGRYVVPRGSQFKNEILKGYSVEGLLDSDEDEDEDEDGDVIMDTEDEDDNEDSEINESDLVISEGEGIEDDDDDLFERS